MQMLPPALFLGLHFESFFRLPKIHLKGLEMKKILFYPAITGRELLIDLVGRASWHFEQLKSIVWQVRSLLFQRT